MTRALRALAVLIAVAGVIDPAIAVSRRQPVRVDFLGSSSASAIAVRDQLIRDLGPDIAADTGEAPGAVVIVADPHDALTLSEGVAVSVVTRVSANARNIRRRRFDAQSRSLYPCQRGLISSSGQSHPGHPASDW